MDRPIFTRDSTPLRATGAGRPNADPASAPRAEPPGNVGAAFLTGAYFGTAEDRPRFAPVPEHAGSDAPTGRAGPAQAGRDGSPRDVPKPPARRARGGRGLAAVHGLSPRLSSEHAPAGRPAPSPAARQPPSPSPTTRPMGRGSDQTTSLFLAFSLGPVPVHVRSRPHQAPGLDPGTASPPRRRRRPARPPLTGRDRAAPGASRPRPRQPRSRA